MRSEKRTFFSTSETREVGGGERERERGKCFCLAFVCRTHTVEEKRCWSVFVLDVEVQLSLLTLMNATLLFTMSASSEVRHYVKMDVN